MNRNALEIINQNLPVMLRERWPKQRSGFLVSVRSAAEAIAAHKGGADVIDIKEPSAGSLGAASSDVWEAVCQALPNALITVALGELEEILRIGSKGPLQLPPQVAAVKAGPAGYLSATGYFHDLQLLPASSQVNRVAVAYADHVQASSPSVAEMVRESTSRRIPWLLIDTFHKNDERLLDWLPVDSLQEFKSLCAACGTRLVLAGSLQPHDFDVLHQVHPAVFAVRGVACDEGRTGTVCAEKVAKLSAKLRDNTNRRIKIDKS